MKKYLAVFLIFSIINLHCFRFSESGINKPPERRVLGAAIVSGEAIAGFTLAEVVITMTIIGVVAVLVIPAIRSRIEDAQLKTKWKKVYSNLNSAALNVLTDIGGSYDGFCNTGQYSDSSRCFLNAFKDNLAVSKICYNLSNLVPDNQGCWFANPAYASTHPEVIANGNQKHINGDPFSSNIGGYPAMVLTDGTMILFHYFDPNGACLQETTGMHKICGLLEIDVNGYNPPNVFGKDMYSAYVFSDGIKPFGVQGDLWNLLNDCNPSGVGLYGYGFSCSALYLMQ